MSTELKLLADQSVTIELLADLPLPAVTRKLRHKVPLKQKVHLSLISQVATNNTKRSTSLSTDCNHNLDWPEFVQNCVEVFTVSIKHVGSINI